MISQIFDTVSVSLPFVLYTVCGICFTLKGNFFQIRRFKETLKTVAKAFSYRGENKGVTSFQSVSTALAATVGTGNIAGVAGAVALGGAGAVFWMWVTAFLGMAIKFCEITLGVKYREKINGKLSGGPVFYIKNGLKREYLGRIFAVILFPAVFCSGNITQSNAAATLFTEGRARLILGITFAVFCFIVIFSGNKKIGKVTEKTVPFMSVIYILLCLSVITVNIKNVPTAFYMIFKGAFNPKAVTGGAVSGIGTAVTTGMLRGIFSNEAGLGTSAMAHSEAVDADAATQGLFGIFEVFLDTGVICTLTALTILVSGVKINYGSIAASELVYAAIFTVFGRYSFFLLAAMMCVFGFSSVIGWASYGNAAVRYLFKKDTSLLFIIGFSLSSVLGAVCDVSLAWKLSAFFNGLMLIINLPAVFLLKGEINFNGKEN